MVSLGDVVRTIAPQDNTSDNGNDEVSGNQNTQEYLVVRKKETGNCTLVPININGVGLNENKKCKLMKSQFTDGTEIYVNYLDFVHIHTENLVLTDHKMQSKRFYWDVSEAHRIHMRDIQRADKQHKADAHKKIEQHIQKIRSDPKKVAKLTAEYEIAAMNNDRKKMEKIEKLLGNAPMKRGKYSRASSLSGSGYQYSISGGKFSSK